MNTIAMRQDKEWQAFKAGKVIQSRHKTTQQWYTDVHPIFGDPTIELRVKPEEVVIWLVTWRSDDGTTMASSGTSYNPDYFNAMGSPNAKLHKLALRDGKIVVES